MVAHPTWVRMPRMHPPLAVCKCWDCDVDTHRDAGI